MAQKTINNSCPLANAVEVVSGETYGPGILWSADDSKFTISRCEYGSWKNYTANIIDGHRFKPVSNERISFTDNIKLWFSPPKNSSHKCHIIEKGDILDAGTTIKLPYMKDIIYWEVTYRYVDSGIIECIHMSSPEYHIFNETVEIVHLTIAGHGKFSLVKYAPYYMSLDH